jgi:hypothetical protein
MDQLKRIGQLCRQHYDKVILVVVLILMGGAVWVIYSQSQNERVTVQEDLRKFELRKVKGVPLVDLSGVEKAIKIATNPPAISLGGKHNLFNPVLWVQYPGQPPKKIQTGEEIGPSKVEIIEIRPLVLSIAFERAAPSGSGDSGYHTILTNDLATVSFRKRIQQFMTVNDTNKQVFAVTEVKGPADNPTELVARLKDYNNESITFAPGKPFVRVVGYEADLKYPLTGASYPKKRKDMPVVIEGDSYKIVDITENKIVLSDDSNGKLYTIERTTAP